MNTEEKSALTLLQATIKRGKGQSLFNMLLKAARQNYTTEQLIQMSEPYRTDELRAAWQGNIYELTLYKKPSIKLKKHELYHELLNVNYDFSQLERTADGSAPKRGRRPTQRETPENTSATKIQQAIRQRLARRRVERIAIDALKSLKTGVVGRPAETPERKALVAREQLANRVNLRVNRRKYNPR